jgi:hypothetical protein
VISDSPNPFRRLKKKSSSNRDSVCHTAARNLSASNAIYPTAIMPGWLKIVSHLNPLTYVVDALRTFVPALKEIRMTVDSSRGIIAFIRDEADWVL